MTDQSSPYDRPDETAQSKKQRRQAVEDAVMAFRPELMREFGDVIGRPVPPPAEALRNLSTADVPRVLKHRLLIDAMRRRIGVAQELDQPAREVLQVTMGGEAGDRESRVNRAKAHLDAVAADAQSAPRLQRRHWEDWVNRTRDIFMFTTMEASFRACDDDESVDKPRPDDRLVSTRLIVAEFWSDEPPAAFTTYIDPVNWPTCSAFWTAMKRLRPETIVAGGYDCDFEETVTIFGEQLTVPLQVAHRARPDGSRVWTRFNIARNFFAGTVPVDVDTGTVSAELRTGGPAQTLVQATKYLHWSDPNRPDFTMLACDFGWCEFMMEMAGACREGFPTTVIGGKPAKESVDEAVRRLVDDVATECRNSIGDYAPHVQSLIGRFTGRSWDARWVNDVLAMSKVTVERYGHIASHVRRFADSVGRASGASADIADGEAGS